MYKYFIISINLFLFAGSNNFIANTYTPSNDIDYTPEIYLLKKEISKINQEIINIKNKNKLIRPFLKTPIFIDELESLQNKQYELESMLKALIKPSFQEWIAQQENMSFFMEEEISIHSEMLTPHKIKKTNWYDCLKNLFIY